MNPRPKAYESSALPLSYSGNRARHCATTARGGASFETALLVALSPNDARLKLQSVWDVSLIVFAPICSTFTTEAEQGEPMHACLHHRRSFLKAKTKLGISPCQRGAPAQIKTTSMKTRHTSQAMGAGTRTVTPNETDVIRDEIVDWLRDAYAMERGLEQSLKKQADSDEVSPQIRNRAAMHLEETRRHAEEVRSALKALGTDTSTLKTGLGLMAQITKGMGTKFASDERIKDLLDAYSMEHFEIACYTALAAAAEKAGLQQVVETCRRIIVDEERMAEALKSSLATETTAYLFEVENDNG